MITPEDRSRRGATVNNEISIAMMKSRDKRKSEPTKKRARLEETGDGELLRVADVKIVDEQVGLMCAKHAVNCTTMCCSAKR